MDDWNLEGLTYALKMARSHCTEDWELAICNMCLYIWVRVYKSFSQVTISYQISPTRAQLNSYKL